MPDSIAVTIAFVWVYTHSRKKSCYHLWRNKIVKFTSFLEAFSCHINAAGIRQFAVHSDALLTEILRQHL